MNYWLGLNCLMCLETPYFVEKIMHLSKVIKKMILSRFFESFFFEKNNFYNKKYYWKYLLKIIYKNLLVLCLQNFNELIIFNNFLIN